MFYTLVKTKIDGKLIRLLYDMYKNTKSKICVDGLLSDLLYDTLGVNQGGPNSPECSKDLFKYCADWQLIVNILKTKVLIFGEKRHDYTFTFNKQTIVIVIRYKYLGAIFSSGSPLFNEHIDGILSRH